MIKFNHRHFVQRLLIGATLPLGFLAAGLIPVYAAVVTVTGSNGANGRTSF